MVADDPVAVGQVGKEGFGEVAAADETVFRPGDAAFARPFLATGLRNDGDEPALLLLVNVVGAGGTMGGEAGATPAP